MKRVANYEKKEKRSSFLHPSIENFSEKTPFYEDRDYPLQLARDLRRKTPHILYTCHVKTNSSSKKKSLFFHGPYQRVQKDLGHWFFLPSSSPRRLGMRKKHIHNLRSCLPKNNDSWRYKRIGISVNGVLLDAILLGTTTTFSTKRWTLFSLGSAEFYETKLLSDPSIFQFLEKTKSSGLLFNYPGVAASQGFPKKETMVTSYLGLLSFLEDPKAIGARTILLYGHSLGAGIQGEALRRHSFAKNISYLAIKSRTFSSLEEVVRTKTNRHFLAKCVVAFDWNLDNALSCQGVPILEIILQTAAVTRYTPLETKSLLIGDNVINKEVTLGWSLLKSPSSLRKEKLLIGIPEKHNAPLSDPSFLAKKVEERLSGCYLKKKMRPPG